MNKLLLSLLVVILLLTACSTLKQPVQPQGKINADNTLKLAQDYELQGRYANSIDSYNYSLELYRSFADIEGQMYALSGLARIALAQGDGEAAEQYRQEMQDLTDLVETKYRHILLLYDLHVCHVNKDYSKMGELAKVLPGMSDSIRMQVLTYAVEAEAYLRSLEKHNRNELKSLCAKHSRKPLKKRLINPQILSEAYYSLAYSYFVEADYKRCLGYLKRSNKLDYIYGNFASLGYGYWLQGKALAGTGDVPGATANFLKAQQIFQSFSNFEMITKLEADMEKLAKGEDR